MPKKTYFYVHKDYEKALNRKLTLILLLCFGILVPSSGQERPGFIKRIVDRILAPSPQLDSAYIYQPRPHWNVSLSNSLRQIGAFQTNEFEVGGEHVTLNSSLQERLYKGIGINAGYGSLQLGYGREIGRKSAEYNKSNSFAYSVAGVSINVDYYNLRQPMSYKLTTALPENAIFEESSGTSEYPGQMKVLSVTTFYALNHKTFLYSSVYSGHKIQRRSAGSWVISGKYLQGEIKADPKEKLSDLVYGLTRHATSQASLGAGYSYNFVLYHRQPGAASDLKGLRNLTVNVTAIPMLTLYDRHYSTRYILDPKTGDYTSRETRPLNSTMRFNYFTNVGASYSWDRFYLSLAANYDIFTFKGTTKVFDSTTATDIKTTGHFNKWSTVLQFNVKF